MMLISVIKGSHGRGGGTYLHPRGENKRMNGSQSINLPRVVYWLGLEKMSSSMLRINLYFEIEIIILKINNIIIMEKNIFI